MVALESTANIDLYITKLFCDVGHQLRSKKVFLNWLQDSEPADELRLKVAHGELGQRDCDVAAPLPVGQHLPEGSLLFTRKQEVIMITNFVSNDLQGHLCDSCWNKE